MSALGNRPSPELTALLKQQSELKTLEKKLASIEGAIAEQNAKIEKARAAVPSIEAIERRIGDLLASEAAGQITERERETREADLNKEAAKVRAAAAEASVKVSRVHATISGLEAQRREAKAAIANAHGECREALDAFLMAEAERVGAEYLEFAKGLYKRFCQLMALQTLHSSATGVHGRIVRDGPQRLFLPAFSVGGHVELTPRNSNTKARLFDDGGVTMDPAIHEATNSERERLAALGVALTWNGSRFREKPDTADSDVQRELRQAAA